MLKYLVRALIFVVALAATVELAYRFQIVDTYAGELGLYNSPKELQDASKRPIMVFGNSISVIEGNYVDQLRAEFPQERFINAAIPGSATLQTSLITRRRFAAFHPKIFIYQISLVLSAQDIRHHPDPARTPKLRYAFWQLSDRFESIGYLNFRMVQANSTVPKLPDAFSVHDFIPAARERVASEPKGIEQTIFWQGPHAADDQAILDNIARTVSFCRPGDCRAFLLIVPHPVQLAPVYADDYEQLGAAFQNRAALQSLDYPFLAHIKSRFKDASNVVVVDPQAALQASERAGIPTAMANDTHPTLAGETVLAQSLAEALRKP